MQRPTKLETQIAWRYVRSRRKESIVSVISIFSFLGITLGVATLIIVMSVMNGFRAELMNKILGLNGHVVVYPVETPLNDYSAVIEQTRTIEGIKFAVPYVEGQALASSASGSSGVLIRGLNKPSLEKLPALQSAITQGDTINFDESGGVIIGERLASSLGLGLGDNLTLVSPNGSVTPFGVTPRIKSYPINAIFKIGMSEFDGLFVYMPLTDAQEYFNKENEVSAIEFYIENPDDVDVVRDGMLAKITRPYYAVDWRQRNATFFSALEVERNVMFIILALIVLVAVMNIISGLIMLVKDKTRDIAILRAMGATQNSILRIFLMAGASIGILGTLAGVTLGITFTLNIEDIRAFLSRITATNLFPSEIYFLSELPADLNIADVTLIVVMTLIMVLLATLYPAWRAARIQPVEGLKYE